MKQYFLLFIKVKKSVLRNRTLLFFMLLFGNSAFTRQQTFEEFCNKIDLITTSEDLKKEKVKEYNLYLKTKNKFHLYNSEYINYVIESWNGNINKALSHLNYVIVDYKLKNTEQLIWINYYMAKTLRNIDAVKVAQKYSLTAINLAKKRKYLNSLEYIYEQLGLIYYKQKKFSQGAYCFKKAYLLTKNTPSKSNFSLARINDVGVCYRNMKDYKKALYYYNLAYKILSEKKNKTRDNYNLLILIDGNKGAILTDLKQYDQAAKLLEKEINYYYEHPELLDISAASTLMNLIEIYEIKHDKKNLNKRLSNLLQIEKQRNDKELSLYVNQFLYKYYQRSGDLSSAIKLSNKLLENSTKNYEKTIEKLSLLSDLVYKQKIIQLKENTKNNSKLLKHAIKDKKKSQLIALITVLFLIVFFTFGVLFYRNSKKNMAKNSIIAKQNLQIMEGINYSKKIQDALLPNINEIKTVFRNFFIHYQPKDIVSGDFYWFKNYETHSVIACVDCTGHGVPGAFMSTIGSLVLDKITSKETLNPSLLLSDLNDEIIRILRQEKDGDMQDGMDLSICIVDHVEKQLYFSGARNGIILVKGDNAFRYKADLLPVGGNYIRKGKSIERQFKTQKLDLSADDWIFMYTDGFIEQIGGKEQLPMNYRQFEHLLVSISKLESEEEKNIFLKNRFEQWKGSNVQSDDILIMGYQIS